MKIYDENFPIKFFNGKLKKNIEEKNEMDRNYVKKVSYELAK